jgi:hypothetical protein
MYVCDPDAHVEVSFLEEHFGVFPPASAAVVCSLQCGCGHDSGLYIFFDVCIVYMFFIPFCLSLCVQVLIRDQVDSCFLEKHFGMSVRL